MILRSISEKRRLARQIRLVLGRSFSVRRLQMIRTLRDLMSLRTWPWVIVVAAVLPWPLRVAAYMVLEHQDVEHILAYYAAYPRVISVSGSITIEGWLLAAFVAITPPLVVILLRWRSGAKGPSNTAPPREGREPSRFGHSSSPPARARER